jgi:hypothetical protein
VAPSIFFAGLGTAQILVFESVGTDSYLLCTATHTMYYSHYGILLAYCSSVFCAPWSLTVTLPPLADDDGPQAS